MQIMQIKTSVYIKMDIYIYIYTLNEIKQNLSRLLLKHFVRHISCYTVGWDEKGTIRVGVPEKPFSSGEPATLRENSRVVGSGGDLLAKFWERGEVPKERRKQGKKRKRKRTRKRKREEEEEGREAERERGREGERERGREGERERGREAERERGREGERERGREGGGKNDKRRLLGGIG